MHGAETAAPALSVRTAAAEIARERDRLLMLVDMRQRPGEGVADGYDHPGREQLAVEPLDGGHALRPTLVEEERDGAIGGEHFVRGARVRLPTEQVDDAQRLGGVVVGKGAPELLVGAPPHPFPDDAADDEEVERGEGEERSKRRGRTAEVVGLIGGDHRQREAGDEDAVQPRVKAHRRSLAFPCF